MNNYGRILLVFISLLANLGCNKLSCVNTELEAIFTRVYTQNFWRDAESASGSGSNLEQTKVIRMILPELIKSLKVKKVLDAPCGDYYWMSKIDLSGLSHVSYIGVDIVYELIAQNKVHYDTTAQRIFLQRDIIHDRLPYADLIICRDCLVHLSFKDALAALRNFKKTGARYILTTTFTRCATNHDTKSPFWRPLNLTKPPFNFPEPLLVVNEKCTEKNGVYADKSLGLWNLSAICL